MRPGTLGRALGTGVRLFARRMQTPPPTAAQKRQAALRHRERGRRIGTGARNLGEGGRRLGRGMWNPFAHAGSILWLEITGLFFLLFTVFFAQHLWLVRTDWRTGPEHQHFLIYAACALLFGYFAVSSFARARKRARRRDQERSRS